MVLVVVADSWLFTQVSNDRFLFKCIVFSTEPSGFFFVMISKSMSINMVFSQTLGTSVVGRNIIGFRKRVTIFYAQLLSNRISFSTDVVGEQFRAISNQLSLIDIHFQGSASGWLLYRLINLRMGLFSVMFGCTWIATPVLNSEKISTDYFQG